ncbi:MAG: glutaredoxin family protein [Xanthomonadales bacterium]|nr:glutaredoxin family protein [Xanthomonadales bacterium]
MTELILYDRPDCHLCEQASALIHALGAGNHCEQVNIEQDIELVRRYGLRIPVLVRRDSGAELDWPFETAALQRFLENAEAVDG